MKELSKSPAVRHERVGTEEVAQRVDNYLLRRCKGVPKSHVYRILRSGEVRVNGRRVGPDYRLQAGDEVRIPPLRQAAPAAPVVPAGAKPIAVLFEDAALLALDKPAGIAVHGGSGVSYGVIEQLRRQRPDSPFLELVHRLDRETSGVLMLAKKRSALKAMHDRLREGEVRKTYLALVRGRWPDPLRHIRLPLEKYLTREGERRVSVSAAGKEAHTVVRLHARWENFSLLEVELKTGRTHQIRVHLAHLGYPLCGDDKYGDFDLNRELARLGLRRMFLHALRLAFDHPAGSGELALHAPLPADLGGFLARLEANETRDYGAAI
jgi:23S rRNA pseudouridine955/2504/2580 synthase